MTVRTRFAPSPTGYLHLGGVRTALYNWLWARKNGGQYLLRIEDTDAERNTEEARRAIIEGFQWLGLTWDEDIIYQSQRSELYAARLAELWEAEKIYPAFETREELDAARAKAEAEKRTYVYDGPSVSLTRDDATKRMASSKQFVWRLRVDKTKNTSVRESLMGDGGVCSFANAEIGDFPLTRSGNHNAAGVPLYNFCNVVDDADQRITHVIRGVEHLGNAARQVLLYEAFGYSIPSFTHLPLIMRNGKKMSKRDTTDPRHSVSIQERKALGYLPEAILNYLALLGWGFSDTEEFADLAKMTQLFDVTKLNKSNANFDEDKFAHFNAWYIRNLGTKDLAVRVTPFLEAAGLNVKKLPVSTLETVLTLAAERARLLSDFPDLIGHFFATPKTYDEVAAAKQFTPATGKTFTALHEMLCNTDAFDANVLDEAIKKFCETHDVKAKDLMPALRLALAGRAASPGSVFETIAILGRPETLARLEAAITFIEKR